MIGRHVAAPRRSSSRRSPIRRLLSASAGLLAGVAIAVIAAGGTYAYLSSTATVPSGARLTAGSAALSVSTPLSLPTTALYPGFAVAGSAVVTNTGTVPLVLRSQGLTPPAVGTPFTGALTVGVAVVANAAACTTAVSPTVSGTFAAPPSGDLGTLAVGASATVCVRASLPAAAPANAANTGSASFAVLVDGRHNR